MDTQIYNTCGLNEWRGLFRTLRLNSFYRLKMYENSLMENLTNSYSKVTLCRQDRREKNVIHELKKRVRPVSKILYLLLSDKCEEVRNMSSICCSFQ